MIDNAEIMTPQAYRDFFAHKKCEFLNGISTELQRSLEENLAPHRNWQMAAWKQAITRLPAGATQDNPAPEIKNGAVLVPGRSPTEPPGGEKRNRGMPEEKLQSTLRELMPWRKGPYDIFNCRVDCEWRSDWKWNRVLPFTAALKGRRVLDIGCGNGYHLWRMREQGADVAVGIEPHLLNVAQFALIQRYFHRQPVAVLPLSLEEYPINTRIYDSVFSMGVLYHRKSPVDHLLHAKSCMREEAQLILETLVIKGDENSVLMPANRYAKMRNVWFIPSIRFLERMLARVGFRNIEVVNINRTSPEEQRRTQWMEFESLPDFLDPRNPDRTVEGYPAPTRAIIIAQSP